MPRKTRCSRTIGGILLIVSIVSMAFLPGCGGGDPRKAVYEFQLAWGKKDRATAMQYCTQRYIDNQLEAEEEMGNLRGSYISGGLPTPDEYVQSFSRFCEDLTVTVTGMTATVVYSVPQIVTATYHLKLSGGRWKIDEVTW
ncbi:MAG: hypothetical protein NTY09_01195 [bacterium]|nr:hypothetical protein [bacterium]